MITTTLIVLWGREMWRTATRKSPLVTAGVQMDLLSCGRLQLPSVQVRWSPESGKQALD